MTIARRRPYKEVHGGFLQSPQWIRHGSGHERTGYGSLGVMTEAQKQAVAEQARNARSVGEMHRIVNSIVR